MERLRRRQDSRQGPPPQSERPPLPGCRYSTQLQLSLSLGTVSIGICRVPGATSVPQKKPLGLVVAERFRSCTYNCSCGLNSSNRPQWNSPRSSSTFVPLSFQNRFPSSRIGHIIDAPEVTDSVTELACRMAPRAPLGISIKNCEATNSAVSTCLNSKIHTALQEQINATERACRVTPIWAGVWDNSSGAGLRRHPYSFRQPRTIVTRHCIPFSLVLQLVYHSHNLGVAIRLYRGFFVQSVTSESSKA